MSSRHHQEDHATDDDNTPNNNVSRSASPPTVALPADTPNTHPSNPQHEAATGLGLSVQDADTALPAMDASAPTLLSSAEAADIPQQQPQPPSPPANHAHQQESRDIISTPPFWSPSSRHSRSASYHSLPDSHRPAAILLIDHTDEDTHQQWRSCWAQSVLVDDYVLVSGPTGIGAYVVWHVTVQTLEGGELELRKRYSEFDRLHRNLIRGFPHAANMIPDLPRKSVISRFRPEFLEERRSGLQHFLTCILLNPEFASSPILKEFVFS